MLRQWRARAIARGGRSRLGIDAGASMSSAPDKAPGGAPALQAAAAHGQRVGQAKTTASPLIVEYYVRQGVFPREDVAAIVETLETPLPACFRVSPNARAASHIVKRLRSEFPALFEAAEATTPSGARVSAPRELEWFPTKYGAWQLDCGKTALAKLAREHAGLRSFRDFLLFHTAEGNVTRQEAVSMIPPLLLDVQPHHRALDMCAAPGSKTSQVMEALQQKLSSPLGGAQSQRGLVVANDANEKRGYLLVHQLQRLGLTDAVVTCHLGQHFPGLYSPFGSESSAVLKSTDVFDRIICDVPCSGDGTIRKNLNLWRQWGPGGALTLHNTQLELAQRAAELLRDDGLMVYSTCSFNPIENEAVVSELLRRADGSIELVDCSGSLPGLVTRPGMSDWQVAWQPSKKKAKKSTSGDAPPSSSAAVESLVWFSEYDAVPEQLRGSRILKSMFPPSQPEIRDQIARCMRLFPTDQNTGGFFVALLRKVGSRTEDTERKLCWLESFEEVAARSPAVPEGYVCALCGLQTHSIRNCPMSRNVQRRQEEQAKQLREPEEAPVESGALDVEKRLHSYTKLRPEHWSTIQQFYGIDDRFPHENLYGRSDGAASICLVSPHIQKACLAGRDLKILDTGVRVFARVPTSSDALVFRPTEDGLHLVLPFIRKRKILVDAADLERILAPPDASSDKTAPKGDGAHPIEAFMADLQDKAADMRSDSGVGPILLMAKGEPRGDHLIPVVLPVWLGHKTLTLLVDDAARKRLQLGEGGEQSEDASERELLQ